MRVDLIERPFNSSFFSFSFLIFSVPNYIENIF